MTPDAAWTLAHLAHYDDGVARPDCAMELATAGLVVATPQGWTVTRRGFAALPEHEQEKLRGRYTPPTRERAFADAAMWRRLEGT